MKNIDISTEFLHITEAQALRDRAFIRNVRRDYIDSLMQELNELIPGYDEMSERDKFAALMKENEKVPDTGYNLVLDFGIDVELMAQNRERVSFPARSLVFSGRREQAYVDAQDFVMHYPTLATSKYGIPNGASFTNAGLLWIDKEERALPPVFRVALIAQYIRENILVSLVDACRFAAGWVDEIEPRRIQVERVVSDQSQVFGWSITIRDTMPSNEMMRDLARVLRALAAWDVEENGEFTLELGTNQPTELPLFDGYEPSKRTPRATTNMLVSFIEDYLPREGLRVRRDSDKSLKKITWKQAYDMFDEMHPGIYMDAKSFETSYNNYRLNRKKGGVSNG